MAALVVSSGAEFGRVVDLWAKPELDDVEAAGAGFRDCFVIRAIEKDDEV